jgi:hypothetical protein
MPSELEYLESGQQPRGREKVPRLRLSMTRS